MHQSWIEKFGNVWALFPENLGNFSFRVGKIVCKLENLKKISSDSEILNV